MAEQELQFKVMEVKSNLSAHVHHFNMCECGFEGISVKVANLSSNQDECPETTTTNTSPCEENEVAHSDEEDANDSKEQIKINI